jgi:predicted alpha/beta superfamily hydrolase
VVFLGDTWANFGTAVETIRLLQFTEDLPPLLVAGIGYRTVDMEEIESLRTRDFTPTGLPSRPTSGGASRFLAFIQDEFKPWLQSRYDVDTDDSMLFGDSLGGLFASYVLLNEPATFRRYGIGSPALDWDNDLVFSHEAEYARTHHDLPARAFFSVGAYENTAGDEHRLAQLPPDRQSSTEPEDWDFVAATERMVAALRSRGYPSLEIECEVLPGEYHETSPPLNLSRSLRYVFGAPR